MIGNFVVGILAQRRFFAVLRWVHPGIILMTGSLTGHMGNLAGLFIISAIIWYFDKGKILRARFFQSGSGNPSLNFQSGQRFFNWAKLQANAAIIKQKTSDFIDENCTSKINGESIPWAKLVEVRELVTDEWRLTFHINSDTNVKDFSNKAGLISRRIFDSSVPVSVTHPQSGVVVVETVAKDFLADPVPSEIFLLSDTEPTGNKCLALMSDGQPLLTGVAHTLVVGATGSGKGSVLWAFIRTLLPAAQEGECVLYGIDPKRTELKGTEALFRKLSFTPEETADLLDELIDLMRVRQESGGRTFRVSRENPLIFVVIDEFAAMSLGADRDTKKRIDNAFFALMTQGRSAGISILAMAQQPQKEVLGNLRSQFVLRVGLRLETSLETAMVFGEGATELGVGCHRIPAATAANDYASAGVGWAQHETGDLVKCRFPYTSDAEIDQILVEAKVWNVY